MEWGIALSCEKSFITIALMSLNRVMWIMMGSTLLNTASSFWLQGTSEKRRWGETPQIRFAHSPPANIHSVAVQLQPHSRAHLKSEIQLARSAFKLAFSRDLNHHNAISHPAFWLSGNACSIRQALGWPDRHGWGPGLQQ